MKIGKTSDANKNPQQSIESYLLPKAHFGKHCSHHLNAKIVFPSKSYNKIPLQKSY